MNDTTRKAISKLVEITSADQPDAEVAEYGIGLMSSGLQETQYLCHKLACSAGWWDDIKGLDEKQRMRFFGTQIALIHSETSEMLEGLRKGKMDDHLPHRTAEEVEAADILIRVFDYCGARRLNVVAALLEKLAYNHTRQDHTKAARESAEGKKF